MNPEVIDRIRRRVQLVYGEAAAPAIVDAIEKLIERYASRARDQAEGWSQKDALLITYADSLLGNGPPLRVLHEFLKAHVGGLLTFIHLLPFYPFTSDDGFAVKDFRAVREDLGTWDDVGAMAGDYRLVFDAVINHVSSEGIYMEGYRRGDPRFADFFVALDPATDTSAVLRTRNLPLLHDYDTAAGKRWLWTTFSRDQIDLNYRNPAVLLEMLDVLLFYAARGAAMVRLDAIPYLWKELGTSCAHLPQTHELIKLLRDVYDAAAPHVLLLTETNVPHRENVRYFGDRGDEAQVIYNFALAPLILWSIHKGNAATLTNWASSLENISGRATYLNITATHDGIGMRPTEGILSEPERVELVRLASEHGGDVTGKRNADGSVSPYELNLNYFDAVNDPRAEEPEELQIRRFVLSQAIPMCLLGMPGIYIHSLLGSRNDLAGVKRTGRARSINREQLRVDELASELRRPGSRRRRVFEAILGFLKTRAGTSAFHPNADQKVLDLGPELFVVHRSNAATREQCVALHNVTGRDVVIERERLGIRTEPLTDSLTGEKLPGDRVPLAGYQVRWLCPTAS